MSELETIDEQVAEELARLPAVREHEAIVARHELSVAEVVAQHEKIIAVMGAVMQDGIHYGTIAGINRPTLLKPGAEAINVALRLAPDYESEKFFSDDGHLTVTAKCTLRHIPTGLVIASGEGLASTREAKYAYRQGLRTCPSCGAASIVRSTKKKAYFCISNEGGCGNRFAFGSDPAKALDEQDTGRVPNPDLADQWNTILKMADKRALIAAVLNGTAASDVFTQDVEDSAGSEASSAGSGPVTASNASPSTTAGDRTDPSIATNGALTSWQDLRDAIKLYGDGTLDDWTEFFKQARSYAFGEDELDEEGKKELWRLSVLAALYLREHVDPSKFPPPTRQDLRDAWAHAMETEEELEGPAWRMSPDETEREPREGEPSEPETS